MPTSTTTPTHDDLLKLIYADGQWLDATIQFHTDPGHGWLQVPFAMIRDLGIKPSRFSYYDINYAYLEEDCDLAKFIVAINLGGDENHDLRQTFWDTVPTKHTDNDSPIRRMRRFSGE